MAEWEENVRVFFMILSVATIFAGVVWLLIVMATSPQVIAPIILLIAGIITFFVAYNARDFVQRYIQKRGRRGFGPRHKIPSSEYEPYEYTLNK